MLARIDPLIFSQFLNNTESSHMNKCGIFILANELLHSLEKKQELSPRKLKVAEQLLSECGHLNVKIYPPRSTTFQSFIARMVAEAQESTRKPNLHPPAVQKCAHNLCESFQVLHNLIQKTPENRNSHKHPGWLEAFTRFDNCWLKFTRLFLQQRLKKLMRK